MDSDQFRDFGKTAIDYIANYVENIRSRDVLPSVDVNFLRNLIPSEVPVTGESWKEIMKDIERVVQPGMTHWCSPNFYSYYPFGFSYPSIVGELLGAGLQSIGITWLSSPISVELAMTMMDWLAKLFDLPKEFFFSSNGRGGGFIQGSGSESILLIVIAAKFRTIKSLQQNGSNLTDGAIMDKLVMYISEETNISVLKAGKISNIISRVLPTDENMSLRGSTLQNAIEEDKSRGLIPFLVVSTYGTTGTCAFDHVDELGPICKKECMWLHIDAVYAGSALVCPQFRSLMPDIRYADSFNVNPHKWLLVNFDCSALWLKDSKLLKEALHVDSQVLCNGYGEDGGYDFRHWEIHLGNRFRSLKLWIVLRTYGVKGLQKNIERHVNLAKRFSELIQEDSRFEIVAPVKLSLVVFRLKGDNELNKKLQQQIIQRRKIFLNSTYVKSKFSLRLAIGGFNAQEQDILFAWNEIQTSANNLSQEN